MKGIKPLVLIVGSTGNLGAVVMRILLKMGVDAVPVHKVGTLDPEFAIIPFDGIYSSTNRSPDLVINLSNFYSSNPSIKDLERMRESIVGVAVAVAKSVSKWRVPVISFSSYFQYAPFENSPWSTYSSLKSEAQDIFISESQNSQISFSDFILYDTYGGARKNKFFDLALQCQILGQTLDASLGEQVLNLTHIEDIAEFVSNQVFMLTNNHEGARTGIFELRASRTLTLRDVVKEIDSVSGEKLEVRWGALPYRTREVFQLWETGLPTPPDWKPVRDLRSYISMILNGAAPE